MTDPFSENAPEDREPTLIEQVAWFLLIISVLVGFGLTAFAPT